LPEVSGCLRFELGRETARALRARSASPGDDRNPPSATGACPRPVPTREGDE
jgi:hypothetical protein